MNRTKELIERAHRGDKEARETIVIENMGLVWSIVRRFSGRGVDMEDLFQIGSIGLIKAIDKFDMSFDVMFSTYAVPMISGEIKRFLRDDGMIKVSRTLKEIAYKAYIAREELEQEGKAPAIADIADRIGVSMEEIVQAMDASADVESLHKVIYQGDGSDIPLIDKLGQEGDISEEVSNKVMIEQMLIGLEENEKQIIYMRYYMDKTQTEIAKHMGISQVQVSRMEKKILEKMRARANRKC